MFTRPKKDKRPQINHTPLNHTVQTKLEIGKPDDKYEKQADAVADKVMMMPEKEEETIQMTPDLSFTGLQMKCKECKEEEESIQTKLIQRQPEEEEELQAKEQAGQTPKVTPNVESKINGLKDSGQSLEPATRSFFEPRLDHDLSHVRVHADSNASEAAKSINARAFTLGGNIVFGSGEYQPRSDKGRRLLAHELTHVVQQNGTKSVKVIQRKASFKETRPIWLNMSSFISQQDPLLPFAITGPQEMGKIEIYFNGRLIKTEQDLINTINRVIPLYSNITGMTNVRVFQPVLNTAEAWMYIPSDPPWSSTEWKRHFTTTIQGEYPKCVEGLSEVTVKGLPSDTYIAKEIKEHEETHLKHVREAFWLTIGLWNTRIDQIYQNRTSFSGSTEDTALANLYSNAGASPEDIVKQFTQVFLRKKKKFHDSYNPIAKKIDSACKCQEVIIYLIPPGQGLSMPPTKFLSCEEYEEMAKECRMEIMRLGDERRPTSEMPNCAEVEYRKEPEQETRRRSFRIFNR